MIGLRFGKLVVLSEAEKKGRHRRFVCVCDCGRKTTPFAFSLKGGKARSCGCVAAQKSKDRWANPTQDMLDAQSKKSTTHGMTHHPAYQSWADMKSRCHNQKHKWYPSYGARGISVCERWRGSFEAFWDDMGDTYFHGATIGRVDNSLGYDKANCRWETREQQQQNRRNSRIVETPDGPMTLGAAARKYGLSWACIRYRLDAGWPSEKVFLTPSQRGKR